MMSDDDRHRLQGYAYVHDGDEYESISRDALERAVAERPSVPLRAGPGGPYLGEAHLSVDETGLKMQADLDVGIAFLRHPGMEISIRESFTAHRAARPKDGE
jgi:hypothetical protein